MRISALLSIAMLAILPVLARADVPPPPDDYSGPPSAHLAGLTFEHERVRGSIDLGSGHLVPGAYEADVLLTDCDAAHANCVAVKKLGVVGREVVAVDGKNTAGDVGVVKAAFDKAHCRRVSLTMVASQQTDISNAQTITFDVACR